MASTVETLGLFCQGLVLMEIPDLTCQDTTILTPREQSRASRMGLKRKREFLAARLALKKLARRLDPAGPEVKASTIETLAEDGIKPALSVDGRKIDLYVSVAHDRRFVVAAAGYHPLGVDVEEASDKVIRGESAFTSDRERKLIETSGLPRVRAATRVWTLKEAAAKALGLNLFESFRSVEVIVLGEDESRADYMGRTLICRHSEIDPHVFSLLTAPDLMGN
ncbi:MAG: 4'-phosphopantetheinyl transferase superfamily protein [Thermodesulfobacteriota bacterium]